MMGNQKYRKEHGQDPQKSFTDNETIASRTARRQVEKETKEKQPKNTGRMLSLLFFVFIFLPVVAALFYVAVLYDPAESEKISASENEVSVEVNTEPVTPLIIEEEKEEPQEEPKAEPKPEPKEEPKAEPKPEPKEEPKAEPKPEPKEEPKAEPKPEPKEEPKKEEESPASRTHTVQAGETLYRIAVNNYGSGEAVDKIRQANGLSSNNLSVGQTLILP